MAARADADADARRCGATMADGPFALVPTPAATRADADASDPYTRGASIMALVHSAFRRRVPLGARTVC